MFVKMMFVFFFFNDHSMKVQGAGELKWYSLINRGAWDSSCEQNSKTSPQDGEGCTVGGRKQEWREEECSGEDAHSQKIALRA